MIQSSDKLKCHVCDSLSGDFDCFKLPNKKKYIFEDKMGALGHFHDIHILFVIHKDL